MNNRCQWCGARLPWSPDSDDVANVCHGAYACSARQAWEEGAAAERAALAAGPAALRAMIEPAWGEGRMFSVRKTISIVEAAQAEAMKERP